MDRHLWTQSIKPTYCPAWPCPVCKKGTLALTKDSIQEKEGVKSVRSRNEDDWDPDWISYAFTAWAYCTHPTCKQDFALAGTGGVTQTMTGEYGEPEWSDYYVPLVCYPMPDIFEIPKKCPDDVSNELRGAFAIFWGNQAASANRLRVALELLLNHVGVQKRKKSKKGPMYDLSLHARIDVFAKSEPTVGPQLMALKWLGNTGSHDGAVSKNDLLDAFEIMEHALGEIVDKRSERVAELAKQLTKKHKRKK